MAFFIHEGLFILESLLKVTLFVLFSFDARNARVSIMVYLDRSRTSLFLHKTCKFICLMPLHLVPGRWLTLIRVITIIRLEGLIKINWSCMNLLDARSLINGVWGKVFRLLYPSLINFNLPFRTSLTWFHRILVDIDATCISPFVSQVAMALRSNIERIVSVWRASTQVIRGSHSCVSSL